MNCSETDMYRGFLFALSAMVFFACSDEKQKGSSPCLVGPDCLDDASLAVESLNCDVVVPKITKAPRCDASNFGQTLYCEDSKTIYSCEDNGLSEEGYWKSHKNFESCEEYVSPYSSSSQTSSKKTSSSSYASSESSDHYSSGKNGCDITVYQISDLPDCDDSTLGTTAYIDLTKCVSRCEEDDFFGKGPRWKNYLTESSCDEIDSPFPSLSSSDWDDESSSSEFDEIESSESEIVGYLGEYGELYDERDGQIYRTVEIGDQIWMAQNLNYDVPSRRTCRRQDMDSCEIYGGLYIEDVPPIAAFACPEGWVLPRQSDWETLIAYVGGKEKAAKVLKSAEGWGASSNGTDEFGFSLIPSGRSFYSGGTICYSSNEAVFLIGSSEAEYNRAVFFNDSAYIAERANVAAASIRCIKEQIDEFVSPASVSLGTLIDPRDSSIYKTVTIGSQEWMAEALNYESLYGMCFKNEEEYCEKYGRFYPWDEAMYVCPEGWHLPSNEEWIRLAQSVGGVGVAGKMLKGSLGWKDEGNGEDAYSFNAVALFDFTSRTAYSESYFWSSSVPEGSTLYANSWNFRYDMDVIYSTKDETKTKKPVRCVKDE